MKLPGFKAEVSLTKFSEQCYVCNKINHPNNILRIIPSIDDCRFYTDPGCGCAGVVGCTSELQSYVGGYWWEDGCPCA